MKTLLSTKRYRPLAFHLGWVALLVAVALPAAESTPPPIQFEETRELIQRVDDAVAMIEGRGIDRACGELQEPGSPWFHDDVYVFVLDLKGDAICHPAQPALQGRSLLELRDPHGKPIVRNFLNEIADGGPGGWVHYLWPRPGDTTFYWKSTYVRRADDEGTEYLVGSGLYSMKIERFFIVEQVDDAARLVEREGEAAFPILRDRASGFRFLDAYIFVMAEDGTELVNVGFPELEGVNLLEFQDTRGKLVSREMLDRLRDSDSAWIEYMWPKPGEGLPSSKSSYVRRVRFDGKLYVVGAGVYLEASPDEEKKPSQTKRP
ncbi:MAG: cache domain-containing protein [Thermoanaerobaculia bacterium]|nr:cache domain-containing protein [Thermoanaerobaculia bacterium]